MAKRLRLLEKKLYAAGWHQGAILDPILMERLRPQGASMQFTHAVVIAQDCNIVNDDKEDRIEVMLGYIPADGQEGKIGRAHV